MFRFWPLFQKHTSLSPLSSAPFPTYPLNGSSKFYVYSFWAPPLPGPRLQVMGASQLPHLLPRKKLLSEATYIERWLDNISKSQMSVI